MVAVYKDPQQPQNIPRVMVTAKIRAGISAARRVSIGLDIGLRGGQPCPGRMMQPIQSLWA